MRYYDGSMAHGEWAPEEGPPYVKHVTMWSDPRCVDHAGPANNVRRILGLRTSFQSHKWNNNAFMNKMNSVQLRFLSRNTNSVLVVPPFHQFPEMSKRAMAMLNDYALVGGNTILVIGGPTGILFINENLAGTDGYGYELSPKWVEGPYEMQDGAKGTAFQYGAVTLPAVGTSVVGVTTASLPAEVRLSPPVLVPTLSQRPHTQPTPRRTRWARHCRLPRSASANPGSRPPADRMASPGHPSSSSDAPPPRRPG